MRPLFAFLCLTAVAYGQSSAPVITSVTPNPVDAGGPAFTLTVSVSSFTSGAVVQWSGFSLATTYVNDNTLAAAVPASQIAICGKYFVTVANAQNNSVSKSYAVIVNPVLKSISPNSLPAGSGSTGVTATGAGFSTNVHLTLNASGTQTDLPTSYGGTTTLNASIPASALAGTYPVSIFATDASSGGVSQTLPITLTTAAVTQIVPDNLYADIATYATPKTSFVLNVGGASFVQGAQVLWDGSPLVTTYVNSGYLTANVPAELVHYSTPDNKTSRIVGVSVKNPGAVASSSLNFVIKPNPFGTTIISLTPPTASTGSPAIKLTVAGERYLPDSTVMWVRTPLPTTYVSATQLTTTIPASLLGTDGAAPITVNTPSLGGAGSAGDSNAVNFIIATALPTVSGISPASANAGGPAFTMTVSGDGFVTASQVIGLDGIATTYVSPKQLTASVPASAIASAGLHNIQVTNPGGLVSPQALVFTVKPPATLAPTVASLSPASAVPGGPAFTLTVAGSGFAANSKVQWNGAALNTTFVSATQLTAAVPAALIAIGGTISITVTGDGGTSNALDFPISPPAPTTTTAGILNAASSLPAIAPGALIAIYGTNLAAATVPAPSTPLPVSLGGTTVSINGANVPLLFVSAGQVNAQVPYETKVGTAKLIVSSNNVAGPAVNFQVAATGPGVFTPPQDSTHVLAVNLSDGTLNASSAPARPGQYVTAYLTGQGVVNPPATTGDVAPSIPPFPTPVAPVQIKIGGVVANVQFAGLAPGLLVMQMNVQIPDVPAGELPFEVSIGGVAAGPTNISVGAKQ